MFQRIVFDYVDRRCVSVGKNAGKVAAIILACNLVMGYTITTGAWLDLNAVIAPCPFAVQVVKRVVFNAAVRDPTAPVVAAQIESLTFGAP